MQKTRTVSCLALPCLPLPSPGSHLHGQRSRGAAPRVFTSARICSNPDTCRAGTASEAAALAPGTGCGMGTLGFSAEPKCGPRGEPGRHVGGSRGHVGSTGTNTKARPRCSMSKQQCPLSTIPETGYPNSSVLPRVMQSRFTMRLHRAACARPRDGGCAYHPVSCSCARSSNVRTLLRVSATTRS